MNLTDLLLVSINVKLCLWIMIILFDSRQCLHNEVLTIDHLIHYLLEVLQTIVFAKDK